jgi:hypothetical protein
MEHYQYVANEQWFTQVIKNLTPNGIWGWPNENEYYQLINGKLKPFTKRGEKLLKKIVRKEFYNNNCVSL